MIGALSVSLWPPTFGNSRLRSAKHSVPEWCAVEADGCTTEPGVSIFAAGDGAGDVKVVESSPESLLVPVAIIFREPSAVIVSQVQTWARIS